MRILINLAKVVLTLSLLYGLAVAAFLGLLGVQGSGSAVIVMTAIGILLLSLVQIKAVWNYQEKWATRWNSAWLVIYSLGLVLTLMSKDFTPVSGLTVGIVPLALLVWHGNRKQ